MLKALEKKSYIQGNIIMCLLINSFERHSNVYLFLTLSIFKIIIKKVNHI
jgi:hypothetical protein